MTSTLPGYVALAILHESRWKCISTTRDLSSHFVKIGRDQRKLKSERCVKTTKVTAYPTMFLRSTFGPSRWPPGPNILPISDALMKFTTMYWITERSFSYVSRWTIRRFCVAVVFNPLSQYLYIIQGSALTAIDNCLCDTI